MKKYITLAALLAAGTASANAATWDDGVKFTGSTFDSAGAWTTTLSGLSATLVLNVDAFAKLFETASSSARPVFVSMTGSGSTIIGLEAHEGNRITGAVGVAAGGTYNNLYSMTGDNGDSLSSIDWANVKSAALTMALQSSTGTSWSLSILNNDGTYFEKTASSSTLKSSGMQDITGVKIDSAVVSAAYAFDGFIKGADAYALNRMAIPEPSAFGMLAGVGALALVASRRRRTQKI